MHPSTTLGGELRSCNRSCFYRTKSKVTEASSQIHLFSSLLGAVCARLQVHMHPSTTLGGELRSCNRSCFYRTKSKVTEASSQIHLFSRLLGAVCARLRTCIQHNSRRRTRSATEVVFTVRNRKLR